MFLGTATLTLRNWDGMGIGVEGIHKRKKIRVVLRICLVNLLGAEMEERPQ